MTLQQLLDQLAAADVRLRRSGDRLDLYAAGAAPSAHVVDGLRMHKRALLAMIADGGVWPPPIRPEMLTLVSLAQAEIDDIVARVPGGAANVQDIYPLAPLQEGILFHHQLAAEGDPYLMASLSRVDTRERLDAFLGAFRRVIERHDILRTAVLWDGAHEPVQVVWRRADLPVDVVDLGDAEDPAAELYRRFDPRHHRIDVRRAPLVRVHVARDTRQGGWLMLLLLHHLAGDHTTMDGIRAEVRAHLAGREHELPAPLPFRNLVAQALFGVSREEHERFFRAMLGDVREPTAPFGLLDARGDGSGIAEARREVDDALAARLRERARALGVSAAALCHVAWAQVLARASGRDDVVFGTLLFGRMTAGEGADRVLGPFINTLPVRIRVGRESAEETARRTHALLVDLLHHEHAPLSLAQRCSGVRAPLPLFTALLNYRYGTRAPAGGRGAGDGIQGIHGDERTNYPLVLSIDDLGDGFRLIAQVDDSVDAARVCAMMHAALERMVDAPGPAETRADVLPEAERRRVLEESNRTDAARRPDLHVHQLFEAQAERTPGAPAVVFERDRLTYAELNARANRLAHHLRALGVGPDARVAVCLERGMEMPVALLAVLKAGGAYVPLDPTYPATRLRHVLADSAPAVLLTHGAPAALLADARVPRLDLAADAPRWADRAATNPDPRAVGLTPDHLAYVIHTSGSTGRPKGVMNAHRGVVNRLLWTQDAYRMTPDEAVLQKTPLGFDVSVWELFGPLLAGARVVMARPDGHRDPAYLVDTIRREGITTVHFVPSMLRAFLEHPDVEACDALIRVVCSGEALPRALARRVHERLPRAALYNLYGPTEAAVEVTAWRCAPDETEAEVPIGRPVANTRIYLLDGGGEPVPVGVAGELHIGGIQVARGYLNQPGMTAERFVPDAFGGEAGARLYRTGDLARWREDGAIDFLGRDDFQVKIRGVRIELGEIEARLREHPAVREAVVAAREDGDGERRLAAWWVGGEADAEHLRAHLAAHLPESMVPAAYVRLDALPLSPNGKLDRAALPAPGDGAFARRGHEAPVGEVEAALAAIWSRLLGVERVGRWDHFFDLGGDSLLAVRLTFRVDQEMDVRLPLRDVFDHPVLRDLADRVVRAQLARFDPDELARLRASMA